MGGGDTKAYYRRAMAHQQLKQLDKALRDAMDSVRIDPKNKSAIDLVMAVCIQYTLYNIHCTLCIMHYTMYIIYCRYV